MKQFDPMITDINQLDAKKTYSYKDYLSWQFQERVELLRGYIARIAPAPSRRHQEVSGQLFLQIGNFLKGQSCHLYSAPFDVRLNADTVVQPDLCIVCDTSKLDEQGCNGAPDLIIEVLSPGNSRKERKEKFELYEEHQVQEYWIVEPVDESIIVYTLRDGKYTGSKPYVPGETVTSALLPGLELGLEEIFW